MTYFILSIIITIVSSFISYFISYKIGYKIGWRKSFEITKSSLQRGTGRMGIIRVADSWTNLQGVIEIEELEVAGHLTKIIIHDVRPDRSRSRTKEDFLLKWGKNDWVETKTITWYDNNTQRIRDGKIEEILKND